MQWNKFLAAVVAVFVWVMVFDMFLLGMTMGSAVDQIPGMREPAMQWLVIGNIAGALVMVWVYDRVRGAFASGLTGGATFGIYAGILIHFPTWLWMTVYNTWPYGATWHATIVLIIATVISGSLIGLVYEKVGAAAAA
jgi:hypothetical protein